MPNFKDLTSQKFGRLTVAERIPGVQEHDSEPPKRWLGLRISHIFAIKAMIS